MGKSLGRGPGFAHLPPSDGAGVEHLPELADAVVRAGAATEPARIAREETVAAREGIRRDNDGGEGRSWSRPRPPFDVGSSLDSAGTKTKRRGDGDDAAAVVNGKEGPQLDGVRAEESRLENRSGDASASETNDPPGSDTIMQSSPVPPSQPSGQRQRQRQSTERDDSTSTPAATPGVRPVREL